MQIARLAALHDMPELSSQAVRAALQSGPPIQRPANTETRVLRRAATVTEAPPDPVAPRVFANLLELEALWQTHRMPAAAVYETLRDVVLPPGRPGEIFLYAPLLNINAVAHPESVGQTLTTWAVRAGKAEELRKAIAARQGRVMAELPASILAVQLGLAAGEPRAAAAALKKIAARLEDDTSRTTSDLAFLAALPALGHPDPDVATAALEVLDLCIPGYTDKPEPLGTLSILMARRQFELMRPALGRKRLEKYLVSAERIAVRSSGDAYVALRRQAIQRVAAESVHAGLTIDALTTLGRLVDSSSSSISDPLAHETLAGLLRQLGDRPAADEYAALHTWTMPEKTRPKIRILTALVPRETPPRVFESSGADGHKQTPPSPSPVTHPTVVSTAAALIDSAHRAGTLDQLAGEARSAASLGGDQKVENAQVLHSLIELAHGQGATVAATIQGRLSRLVEENLAHQGAARRDLASPAPSGAAGGSGLVFPWPDFLLARAAARDNDRATSDLGVSLTDALLERARLINDPAALAITQIELVEAKARRAGAAGSLAPAGLALWHSATTRTADVTSGRGTEEQARRTNDEGQAIWIAEAAHVAHRGGAAGDLLLLDYPLTGTFQFSVDAYAGLHEESLVISSGLVIKPFSSDRQSEVFPIGRPEFLTVPWRLSRPSAFNRITVEASPGDVRYLVNGHLFHEDDDPSPTCPWLGLVAGGKPHSVWRHFRLDGKPSIPREVRLTADDRLAGWVSDFFSETQPPRITRGRSSRFGAAQSRRGGNEPGQGRSGGERPSREPGHAFAYESDFDWSAADGIIHGRRIAVASPPPILAPAALLTASPPPLDTRAGTEADQSLLYYFRPLKTGDVLTYEFLYEPSSIVVYPALGRLAFLLEPDGVKVHWMTSGSGNLSGLPADNHADEPANRRGPKRLPLKPGEWNTIKLALEKSTVTLDLNGQPIFERPINPDLGRQFGFFHYKDQTTAQARNVVLRGQWPQSVSPGDQAAWLLSPDPSASASAADRRARHDLIGESFYALEAGDVIDRALPREPGERYAALAAWVLAAPEHPVWRLAGEFTPSFPAVSAVGKSGKAGPVERPRMQTGGTLRAPAIELMAAARAAGKLDDLSARIEAARIESGVSPSDFEPGKLALLGLVAIERADDDAATKALTAMARLPRALPMTRSAWMRWPDLVLAARALDRPALRPAAVALLDAMIAEKRLTRPTEEDQEAPQVVWQHQLAHLRARADQAAQAEKEGNVARPFGTDPETPLWARVTQTTAATRGSGRPIAHWTDRGGVLTHYAGHNLDMMYLTVPLRGDFQVDCELTGTPGRAIAVSYGGIAIFPGTDSKHLERFQLDRRLADVAIVPPQSKLDNPLGEWYSFRLLVKGTALSVLINGQKVYETRLPAERDPWLALFCPADQAGSARSIKISGSPQVPARLDLSAAPDLSGWMAGEYGDTVTGNDPDWFKRGGEISGRRREEASGTKEESVLRYNRPMVEDGRISYEFYHEPGKVMVHPALDRLAFLIEPSGVKVHWLSDGAYERAAGPAPGPAPGNTEDDPEKRRPSNSIQLMARAWNRVDLDLTGDRVSLRLNGQLIDERQLDPVNQRSFGLFHFAGETEARVRNVNFEGRWPRNTP